MINGEKYLQRIAKLEKIIENRLNDAEHWKSIAFRITSVLTPDKVQSSGSQQKMAEAVERCLDIAKEICESIDKLYDEKREIVSMIEKLDVTDYDILHKLYVEFDKYPTYDEVAVVYKKSNAWVSNRHNEAIERLVAILTEEKMKN